MPPGLEARDDEPDLPRDLDLSGLPRGVRAELRGLPPELAEKVSGHLVMAGELIEDDPPLALRHALVARRLASRLPVVREAAAEAAYAAEDWATALTEYRALRRISGDDAYLPVIADCERAVGKPEEALRVIREAAGRDLDEDTAVELRIVEAGARNDTGQRAEALRLLKREIQTKHRGGPAARLRYAYADLLLAGGDTAAAREWFEVAARLDTEHTTDAEERLGELDGVRIDFDDSPADAVAEDAGTEETDVAEDGKPASTEQRNGTHSRGDDPAGEQ
ncbi:hypothetical protein [Granulicoccus phenolivorans]|uniref:hypothetical protein n=1 Tax=Granulicoccus phenolivorans TaxID=266854 RepID=UPI000408D3F6|nr:hypothetical protein [Granulicoccus phenolivorans]